MSMRFGCPQDINVVVRTIGNTGLDNQIPLIDAAVAAGVKRFIPGELGADPEHPKNKPLPFYIRKLRILDHLKAKAEENPDFSYTRITTHAFLDRGITEAYLLDPNEHKSTALQWRKHALLRDYAPDNCAGDRDSIE